MAGFVLPTFNLDVGIWRPGSHLYNPPDVETTGNLSPGRITGAPFPEGLAVPIGLGGMWLRLPIGTDIRDPKAAAGSDTCEVPRHSQRFYSVQFVDDIGFGFTNEHRFAIIQALGTWPTPFPNGQSAPLPPLPYPPTLLSSFSSSGAQVNTITFTITPTSSGHCWVIVQWGGPPTAAPTCNGNNPVTGSQQTCNTGLSSNNMAVFFFNVSAVALNVTITLPVATNRQISGYALFDNYLTVVPQAANVATGTTAQPSVTASSNPFGASLKLMLGTFGLTDPPAGFAVVSPWIPVASATDTIASHVHVVQTSCIVSPTGGLPALVENPAAGPWTAWMGQIDMGG